MSRRWIAGPVLALVLGAPAAASDWPQWLGPNRDGVWAEKGTLDKFPEGGPKVLWRQPIGSGFAGPAVVGGRVYVMDRKAKAPVPKGAASLGTLPGIERVLCLDAKTGEPIWKHEYDCPYTRISYPEGPRTTPVVEGNRVYTLGTMGDLLCLDAATGRPVWAKNFVRESGEKPKKPGEETRKTDDDKLPLPPVVYNVMPPIWGYSSHLLLHGDKLVTLVGGDGGAVRAFDKKTGKELWKALTDREVCYAPTVLARAGGTTQLIAWTSRQLAGLNPDTGAVYWKLKFPNLPEGKEPNRPGPAVNIATPKVAGDMVFVSSAYDGCMAVRLAKDRPAAAVAWGSKVTPKGPETLPTLMTTLLVRDGHLFGVNNDGEVECRKADTGELVWKDAAMFGEKKPLFASAFWVENGDKLFVVTDLGDLVVCKLTLKGYEELDRAHVIEPDLSTRGRKAVWCHPAFADGCLITRNGKEIICVSLAKG
jgi:outer membrane protein assembly factor BamB